MNWSTPYYYFRAVQVLPKVKGKLDCIRGRPYWTEGPEGKFRCIENRSCLLMYDSWEKEIKAEIAKTGRGVFLDVGANIGRLSVFAGKLGMTVFSMEPHKEAYEALKVNLKVNEVQGMALDLAAWSGFKSLPFYVSKSSALSNVWGKDVFGGKTEQEYSVQAVPIDALELSPSVVKIDAERSEVEIIKGMLMTILRCHPKIIFESFVNDNLERCKERLTALGYRITKLDSRNYVAV